MCPPSVAALRGIARRANLGSVADLHGLASWRAEIRTGYGLARFVVEFVRQPDAQFVSPGNPLGLAWQVSGWGLTMGQLLSLPMIAIGIYFILRAKRNG